MLIDRLSNEFDQDLKGGWAQGMLCFVEIVKGWEWACWWIDQGKLSFLKAVFTSNCLETSCSIFYFINSGHETLIVVSINHDLRRVSIYFSLTATITNEL